MQDRIEFRKLENEDVDALFKIYADEEAMKFRGSKAMSSIEEAKQFVQNQRSIKREVLTVRKGVVLLKENEIIGSAMYRVDQNEKDEVEIGYSIGRQFWGRGYGTEIVKLLVNSIQETNKFRQIIAWSHIDNLPSIKILAKNGFARVEQRGIADCYLYRKKLG